jgi:hypothetical protein
MCRTTEVAAAAVGFAAVAFLAVVLSPWYEVANHPVRLTLQASVDAIDLCWAPQGCAHFVRKPSTPDVWLAELPPERRYDVRLYFPNGVETAARARIAIFDTDKSSDPLLKQTIVPLMDRMVDIPQLAPGGDVTIGAILAPSGGFSSAAILLGVMVALLAGVVLGGRSLIRPPRAPLVPRTPISSIVLVALAATIAHVLLVRSFPIVYYLGADSDDYMVHALNLADHFHYRIPGRDAWSETVRTPGYAVLLAGIFLAFGKHLSTAVLVQSILFMAAVSCLALALRRWASTALLGTLIAIAAIMPPDIEMSRGIQSDGPATTFALFSVAAFIEAGCRDEKARRIMMGLGAATAAFAVLVRPTAIVVLIIPGLMALQAVVAAWPALRWRSGQAAIPVLSAVVAPTIVVLLAWSTYNWVQFRYFGASNFTQTIRFTGRMDTGTFDVRSLDRHEPLRQAYLVGREGTGYWQYHVHFVAPILFVKNQSRYVSQINAGLSDVVNRSDSLNPWQLKAVRLLRGVWWGALLPPTKNYNGYPFPFHVLGWNVTPDAVQRAFPGVVLDTSQPSALFAAYSDWGPRIYNLARPMVYLLALLAAFWALCTRGWLLAAPMLVQTANIFVHAGLGVIYARYIQGLDILLFAQVAIGLALLRDVPMPFRTPDLKAT